MQTLIQDLRYALRQLRRSPSFALTVIATLALGIGLSAAIFTVVDCVLLRPLGYRDADRIVALRTHFIDEGRSIPRLGGDDYRDLAQQVHGLQATAYYQAGQDAVALHGEALYLPVAGVSPRFGEVLGVEPVAGRLFGSADVDGLDALVSAEFARDHFGSAQAALGQALAYMGASRTIVGVLPPGFSYPEKTAVWFEEPAFQKHGERSSYNDNAIAKRRAGVSDAELAAELAAFSHQLQQAFPEDRHKSLLAVPLKEELVGTIRPTLHLLLGSVALLLLIVCANLTHLQLVRAAHQLRSTTIRTALGATRRALAGRALLEALLLAALGGAAALFVAAPALRLLLHLAPPEVPRLGEIRLNLHVLLFSFLVSVVLMSLTAVLPVWRSWRLDPAHVLRQDVSRGTESRGAQKLRNSFVVTEIALTLMLSVAAVLLTRQLIAQSREDLGFAPENLITLDTHAVLTTPAPVAKDDSPASRAAVKAGWDRIDHENLVRLEAAVASLAAVPGVDSTAAISGAPMGFAGSDLSYAVKGQQVFAPGSGPLPNANIKPITPNLLRTIGVPLVRGRAFLPGDRSGSPPVVLINQQLAAQVFAGEDPVGRQIMWGYDEATANVWVTIVGVVGNVHDSSPWEPPLPTFYVPVAQHLSRTPDMQLVVRTHGDPAAMAETLRRRLLVAHPDLAVKATTMRENIGETQRGEHFRAVLFGSFAGVSILLAAVGMYGVTAYTVSQRRFEFGLRLAVGATRTQLLGLVLRNALGTAALGIAIGSALAVSVLRLTSSLTAVLPAVDSLGYALAAAAVLLVALLATLLPARAAANCDPVQALRAE